MILSIFFIVAFESFGSLFSLSFFKNVPESPENQIQEVNSWLNEQLDKPAELEQTFSSKKDEAALFLSKYAEFSNEMTPLPLNLITVAKNVNLIVTTICILKFLAAVFFMGGEKWAGYVLAFWFYPVRILFYFNPYSMYN